MLLKAEHPHDRIYLYGKTADRGRDIVWLSEGKSTIIQCKRYADGVGVDVIRAELAKLCVHDFRHQLPDEPDAVEFYVSSHLTSPAQDLLRFQTNWRDCANDAISRFQHRPANQKLSRFARRWWPAIDFSEGLVLTGRVQKFPDLLEDFFGVRKVVDNSVVEARFNAIRDDIRRVESLIVGKPERASEGTMEPAAVRAAFKTASSFLLNWRTTLANERWIDRPELTQILRAIQTDESSATVVLGGPGAGKSAPPCTPWTAIR